MLRRSRAPLEAHDRYIDVQIPLRVRGEERFGWRPRERCILPRGEFDEAADIVFFDDKPSCYVSLHPGEFVVFFPEDAHAPLIGSGNVRKAILKIRAV
ncbi:MAG: YhcH/YjgK/YiaL family protein [Alistipes sp.]